MRWVGVGEVIAAAGGGSADVWARKRVCNAFKTRTGGEGDSREWGGVWALGAVVGEKVRGEGSKVQRRGESAGSAKGLGGGRGVDEGRGDEKRRNGKKSSRRIGYAECI